MRRVARSDETNKLLPIARRRSVAILCVATVLCYWLLGWMPFMDYHILLTLESPEEAEHECETLNITVEHGLTQGFIGYAGTEQAKLFLYSTELVREVRCQRVVAATAVAEGEEAFVLHYRDVFLNISHHDVDAEAALLHQRFPLHKTFRVWRYYAPLGGQDQHHFHDSPRENNDDTILYVLMCFLRSLLAITIVFPIWYYRSRGLWRNYYESDTEATSLPERYVVFDTSDGE